MWDLVSSMQELHLVILYGMHRANSWLKCDIILLSLKMIEVVVYLQRCVQASLLEGQ